MFNVRPSAKIAEGDEASEKRADELILCMGNSLPFFQELHNFTLRCMRVARNIVCQIAGSLTDDVLRSVRVIPVAEALATVLSILITVDSAVANNVEVSETLPSHPNPLPHIQPLSRSQLNDAWRLYKMVVREKSAKNSADNVTDANFATFEKALVELDNNILSAKCFLNCIEQDLTLSSTNPSSIEVRNNTQLHNELKALVSSLYDRYNSMVGSASETTERHQLIGVYGMYALYRRILPANEVPDGKLFKKLFLLFPDRCPVINICGDASFFPANFLMEYAPFEVKGVDPSLTNKKAVDFVKRLDAR